MYVAGWIIGFLLGISSLLPASEQARHDMREICRSEVSGTLLSAYNDVDYLGGLIAQSEQKVKDSKTRQAMLDLEYARLRKDTTQPIPAFDLDERVLAFRFELDTLRDQIREAEAHIAENKVELSKREEFRKKFEGLALAMFRIVKPKDSPPGAYNFRLEYKHECGIYEMLCPLPKDQAVQLKTIAEHLTRPQWCERYSQLLPQQ